MKVFAFALLCFVAAVQARSTAVQTSSRSLAELGENPWLLHLRLAVSTSGFLNSCAGSLIDQSWILTTAGCVHDSRFIWVRYGVVTVINPELVTESSAHRLHPTDDLALISINRVVQTTDNIAPVALSSSETVPESTNFCGFGEENDGSAGERLSCYGVSLEAADGKIVAHSEDGHTTRYDVGAPLIADGVQIGILTSWSNQDNAGTFLNIARYRDWIQETTGLSL